MGRPSRRARDRPPALRPGPERCFFVPPLTRAPTMKNLYDPARVTELKSRIAQLRADSPRQWGKMDVP